MSDLDCLKLMGVLRVNLATLQLKQIGTGRHTGQPVRSGMAANATPLPGLVSTLVLRHNRPVVRGTPFINKWYVH